MDNATDAVRETRLQCARELEETLYTAPSVIPLSDRLRLLIRKWEGAEAEGGTYARDSTQSAE